MRFLSKLTLISSFLISTFEPVDTKASIINHQVLVLSSLKGVKLVPSQKSFSELREEIINQESQGDPTIVNRSGYMGLYQIGELALKDLGYGITLREFRSNPNCFPESLQHKVFSQLLQKNWYYLRNYKGFVGDTIKGIKIDTSCLVVASTGAGVKSVKVFLKSKGKIDPTDGFGVPVSVLLRKYSNYNLGGLL